MVLRELRFLGFDLLRKTKTVYQDESEEKGLTITVVPEFETDLILPPSYVVSAGSTEIQKYLHSPESYLNNIKDITLRLEALKWVIQNFQCSESFSLAGQVEILHHTDFSLEQELRTQCFREIQRLDLSNCNLQDSDCPDLSQLPQLTSLILKGNKIEDLESINKNSLVELNIVDNPIKEIRWEKATFGNLKSLHFGSPETQFISHQVLSHPLLELNIPAPNHRKALLCPLYSILENPQKLDEYKKMPMSILGKLSSEQRKKAFMWILDKSQAEIKELDLSQRSELFKKEPNDTEILINSLNVEKLPYLTELNLQKCGLKSFPPLNRLPLKTLDLSYNQIADAVISLDLPKLELLNLTGNPIRSVYLELNFFKKLKHLQLGSNETKFIHFNLVHAHLETHPGKHIEIQVDELYWDMLFVATSGPVGCRQFFSVGMCEKSGQRLVWNNTSRR